MTNTLIVTACTMPEHEFRRYEEWNSFHKKDDVYRRERIRCERCIHCQLERRNKVLEWESYGADSYRGNLADWLSDDLTAPACALLKELYRANNRKQWNGWKAKMMALHPHFMEATDALYRKGIVIKRERRDRFRTSAPCTVHVYYNEQHLADIERFIGADRGKEPGWLSDPVPSYRADSTTSQGRHIEKILISQRDEIAMKGSVALCGADGAVVLRSSSKRSYAKMLRALYGLRCLAEQGSKASWKTFSQQFFEDTKELTTHDKKRLVQIVGSDLSEYGILPHHDELTADGHFCWEYDGAVADSKALGPYVRLQTQTVEDMNLLSWQPSSLLLIENEDLFLGIVKQNYLNPSCWAVLYGGGYVSSADIDFIARAIEKGLRHIYVWPDLDPYGYYIACRLKDRLCQRCEGVSVSLFGFNTSWFCRSPVTKDLKPVDVVEIDRLLSEQLPAEVREALTLMRGTGKKGEQEILIQELVETALIQNDSIPL